VASLLLLEHLQPLNTWLLLVEAAAVPKPVVALVVIGLQLDLL
jgi:hypothetical protein